MSCRTLSNLGVTNADGLVITILFCWIMLIHGSYNQEIKMEDIYCFLTIIFEYVKLYGKSRLAYMLKSWAWLNLLLVIGLLNAKDFRNFSLGTLLFTIVYLYTKQTRNYHSILLHNMMWGIKFYLNTQTYILCLGVHFLQFQNVRRWRWHQQLPRHLRIN